MTIFTIPTEIPATIPDSAVGVSRDFLREGPQNLDISQVLDLAARVGLEFERMMPIRALGRIDPVEIADILLHRFGYTGNPKDGYILYYP